jgi:hypothetical protein
MLPAATAVLQDVRVRAAGVGQHVRQHGEAVRIERAGGKGALLVDGLGQLQDGAAVPSRPGGVDARGGAERVTEDVAEDRTLSLPFFAPRFFLRALDCFADLDHLGRNMVNIDALLLRPIVCLDLLAPLLVKPCQQ